MPSNSSIGSFFWIGSEKTCPVNSFINSTATELEESKCLDRKIFVLGLFSDLASMLGAFLIILSFFLIKELKTTARYFLLFLSVADFFNAFFYFTAHIWSLAIPVYSVCYRNKSDFETYYCVAQSTFNVFFSLSSYYWTTVLAVHVVLLVTVRKQWLGNKIIFRALLAFGIMAPFIVSVLGLLLNRLGPGFDTVSAGWCFVGYHNNFSSENFRHIYSELLTGILWDFIALVSITSLNAFALLSMIYYRLKYKNISATGQDLKLILIPTAYLFLRFWGYLRWVIQFNGISPQSGNFSNFCENYTFLVYLQAIGDPGQGWVNAILYLAMTKSVRVWIVRKCRCGRGGRQRKESQMHEASSESIYSEELTNVVSN